MRKTARHHPRYAMHFISVSTEIYIGAYIPAALTHRWDTRKKSRHSDIESNSNVISLYDIWNILVSLREHAKSPVNHGEATNV